VNSPHFGYIDFVVPDEFVVGYRLDSAEDYRGLKASRFRTQLGRQMCAGRPSAGPESRHCLTIPAPVCSGSRLDFAEDHRGQKDVCVRSEGEPD
jgi:hypothetical protein